MMIIHIPGIPRQGLTGAMMNSYWIMTGTIMAERSVTMNPIDDIGVPHGMKMIDITSMRMNVRRAGMPEVMITIMITREIIPGENVS